MLENSMGGVCTVIITRGWDEEQTNREPCHPQPLGFPLLSHPLLYFYSPLLFLPLLSSFLPSLTLSLCPLPTPLRILAWLIPDFLCLSCSL